MPRIGLYNENGDKIGGLARTLGRKLKTGETREIAIPHKSNNRQQPTYINVIANGADAFCLAMMSI